MPFDESNRGLAREILKKYSNLRPGDIKSLLDGSSRLTYAVAETILSKVDQGKIEAADIRNVAKVIEILSPLMSFKPELYLSQCEAILN